MVYDNVAIPRQSGLKLRLTFSAGVAAPSPSRPGEFVGIDSTPMDLMVVYPDGSSGRVDLTVALDIATRTPLAAILRPVATKAVDAAVLLAVP